MLAAQFAAAVGRHLTEQPRLEFLFPADSPKPPTPELLTFNFCAPCQSEDGARARRHEPQSHPIRVMVDFGYVPPNRSLKPEEVPRLKAWLEPMS